MYVLKAGQTIFVDSSVVACAITWREKQEVKTHTFTVIYTPSMSYSDFQNAVEDTAKQLIGDAQVKDYKVTFEEIFDYRP